MKTKVSFIMTVKNGEKYIDELIHSIQKQTIECWEFIIIDDGSDDNTQNIIKEYMIKDSRIKLIKPENFGRGYSLNLAIEEAASEFIANIDVDDPAHPQRAEIQMNSLEKNLEYSALATDFLIISDNTKLEWSKIKKENKTIEVIDRTIRKEKPFFKASINHSSIMFRREDLIKIGKYDETRRFQFDYELWIRYSFSGYKIGLIEEKLATKRIHKKQSFEAKNRIKYLRSSLELNKYVLKTLKPPFKFYVFVYSKYLYGFLPRNFRRKIRTLL